MVPQELPAGPPQVGARAAATTNRALASIPEDGNLRVPPKPVSEETSRALRTAASETSKFLCRVKPKNDLQAAQLDKLKV